MHKFRLDIMVSEAPKFSKFTLNPLNFNHFSVTASL